MGATDTTVVLNAEAAACRAREDVTIAIDGVSTPARAGEWLVEAITREKPLPHICYHPQLGPIQSCDTCLVEVDGQLRRACSTAVSAGLNVITESPRARKARLEAM